MKAGSFCYLQKHFASCVSDPRALTKGGNHGLGIGIFSPAVDTHHPQRARLLYDANACKLRSALIDL